MVFFSSSSQIKTDIIRQSGFSERNKCHFVCEYTYESHNVSGGAGLKVCCYEQVVRAHPQVAGKLVTAQRAAYLQAGLQVGPAVSPGLEKKQEVINSIEV